MRWYLLGGGSPANERMGGLSTSRIRANLLSHRERAVWPQRGLGFLRQLEIGYRRLTGHRAIWKLPRSRFGIDFRTYMDRIMAESEMAQPSDDVADWRASLADQVPQTSAVPRTG